MTSRMCIDTPNKCIVPGDCLILQISTVVDSLQAVILRPNQRCHRFQFWSQMSTHPELCVLLALWPTSIPPAITPYGRPGLQHPGYLGFLDLLALFVLPLPTVLLAQYLNRFRRWLLSQVSVGGNVHARISLKSTALQISTSTSVVMKLHSLMIIIKTSSTLTVPHFRSVTTSTLWSRELLEISPVPREVQWGARIWLRIHYESWVGGKKGNSRFDIGVSHCYFF